MSAPPVQFGRYQLLRKLGRGGMAEVFLAQLVHGGVAKHLAIKRLLPPFNQRPEIVERLAAEARVTVWLTHPNIVQVYDFGLDQESGRQYIVMEYVEGNSGAEILAAEGISVRLLNMHTIKPIDRAAIVQAAEETGAIVTAEDHQIHGGLGGAVAEVLTQ